MLDPDSAEGVLSRMPEPEVASFYYSTVMVHGMLVVLGSDTCLLAYMHPLKRCATGSGAPGWWAKLPA
jgi:hypothetical protein